MATRRLSERGVRGGRHRAVVDQAAAVEILQGWLDAARRQTRCLTIWTWPGRSSRAQAPARRSAEPAGSVSAGARTSASAVGRSFGALFVSLLLLAVLGGGVYWGVGKVQDYFGTPPTTTEQPGHRRRCNVTVDAGDTASDIGDRAATTRRSSRARRRSSRPPPPSRSSKNIQPGTYKLFEQMPATAALAILLDPDKNMLVNKVTIPEGLTVDPDI